MGSTCIGEPPLSSMSLLPDVEFIRYKIHDFANRHEKRGEYCETKAVIAHGYPWKLRVFPRGKFISLFVRYAGEDDDFINNMNGDNNSGCSHQNNENRGRVNGNLRDVIGIGGGVTARANFVCKEHKKTGEIRRYKHTNDWGFEEFLERDRILTEGFLDRNGALTIDVELEVCVRGPWYSGKRHAGNVWYPKETIAMLQNSSSSSIGNSFSSDSSSRSSDDSGNNNDEDDFDYDYSGSTNHLASLLFSSMEFADVTFNVSGTKFKAHRCVLAVKCRTLLELVLELENDNDDSDADDDDITRSFSRRKIVELNDVQPKVFQTLLEYVYGVRKNITTSNYNCDDQNIATTESKSEHEDESYARELLLAGNRFGCSHLKLYAESVLVDKHLTLENSAEYLPLSDSHTCALLKEATLDMVSSNPQLAMESKHWYMVEESSRLLTELLLHYNKSNNNNNNNNNRNAMTMTMTTTNTTSNNNISKQQYYDHMDVTSLRCRLEDINLACDGSREMLVNRLIHHEDEMEKRASNGKDTPSAVARQKKGTVPT